MVAGVFPSAGWVENQLLQNGASGLVARLRARVTVTPWETSRSLNAWCCSTASAESAASSWGGGALWKALVASVSRLKRKFTGSISRACAAARVREEAGINAAGTWDMRDTPWAAQA